MWKPTVEVNEFYNYDVHVPRPQNNESGEPDLKEIGDKLQYKNDLILHNNIIDARWKQITVMIK